METSTLWRLDVSQAAGYAWARGSLQADVSPYLMIALMQRGLRLIPSSEDMWHAYHGLELAYVVKLIHRRRILGIDAAIVEEEREITGEVKGNKKRSAEEEGEEEEGEDDGHILLPTITDEEFKEGEKTEEEKAEEEKQRLMLRSNSDAFLAGALPRIVYRHAIVGK